MKPTSLLSGLLLFAAGIAVGWFLAQRPTQQQEVSTNPAPSDALVTVATPEAKPAAQTIWLTVEFDGGSSLVPAVRLDQNGLLLASLFAIYPANSIHYRNTDGEQVFPQVVGADAIQNLIALKDNHSQGRTLSDDDGSLYIGKSVTLDLPGRALESQIETALQTAPNGRNYFGITYDHSEAQRGGPLLDPDTSQLIGFVTTRRARSHEWMHLDGEMYSAVDATTLRNFLTTTRNIEGLNVRSFTTEFARAPGGLRYSISAFAQRNQWQQTYQALEQLATLDSNNADITQQALTLAAYYYGHQLIDSGEPQAALNLTQAIRQRFADQQPWCLIEARAHASLSHWDTAFARAQECLRSPYGLHPRDRETLATPFREILKPIDSTEAVTSLAISAAVRYAETPTASREQRISVLLEALTISEHPHVYRLLGDLEYEARNYAVAQNYYRAAIRLDPSIAAALENRLRNSTQRADSKPATEIPFEPRGGGLVVTARLNNSPQNFRLLVDTGATYSALSGGTLLRLGLGHILNGVPDVVELEAAGGTLYAQRFTLDSMQIGDARVSSVPVIILENLEGFDGLVGLSFLRHFDVSIDQEARKLILVQQ